MPTISLQGADAKVFIEAWRDDMHVVGPRLVVCTKCGVKAGECCVNKKTGRRNTGYHAERHKLERRVRALVHLKVYGPITAGGFAELMWTGCAHANARNAAGFLQTLCREGLVRIHRNPGGTTYEARRQHGS